MSPAARWRASPNHDERAEPVDMLILHYTGMKTAEAALDRLCDPAARVSAHYVIKEGGTVWQLVDDGLIGESHDRPAPQHDDERRRYYEITPAGRRALAADLARLKRLVAAARPRRLASLRSRG